VTARDWRWVGACALVCTIAATALLVLVTFLNGRPTRVEVVTALAATACASSGLLAASQHARRLTTINEQLVASAERQRMARLAGPVPPQADPSRWS
jgi:hypothetical protein